MIIIIYFHSQAKKKDSVYLNREKKNHNHIYFSIILCQIVNMVFCHRILIFVSLFTKLIYTLGKLGDNLKYTPQILAHVTNRHIDERNGGGLLNKH